MIRLGFLGAGWIGRNRMAAMLATGAEAVAVADPSPEAVAAAREIAPGAAVVDSLAAMLALRPRRGRHRHAQRPPRRAVDRALDAGVAVFCQKPLGRSAEEAARRGRCGPPRRPAAGARPVVPLHRRHGGDPRAGAGGRAGTGLRRRPDLPQRLRPGQAVVLRPRAVGRRLRHRPRRPPRRPRAVAARRRRRGRRLPPTSAATGARSARTRSRTSPSPSSASAGRASASPARGTCTPASMPRSASPCTARKAARRCATSAARSTTSPPTRFRGTASEVLSTPPDDWGGRAAADWARRLAAGERFDPAADGFVAVADVLDQIYASGLPANSASR